MKKEMKKKKKKKKITRQRISPFEQQEK